MHIFHRKPLKKALRDIVMATKPSKSDLADSVQIALDAADTATGVTEEFNSIKTNQFFATQSGEPLIHTGSSILATSWTQSCTVSLQMTSITYSCHWSTDGHESRCGVSSYVVA